MMNVADLTELAARVETSRGPDDAIDLDIATWCYENGSVAGVNYDPALWIERNGGEFTGSIDAAMTLLPTDGSMTILDVTMGWEQNDSRVWPAITVRWYPPHKSGPNWHAEIVTAATLPLALSLAALRVRARAGEQ